jgi:hypothetical protein
MEASSKTSAHDIRINYSTNEDTQDANLLANREVINQNSLLHNYLTISFRMSMLGDVNNVGIG